MAIDKKLGYSRKTQALIDRMCRNVERENFDLDKKHAEELLIQTYDLFGLNRPGKIVWHNDIFDESFRSAAWLAGSVGSAGSAWLAWLAGSVGSAGSAGLAGSAGSAWSAWSVGSAGSAGSVGSVGSVGSALDYDFDYFVMEYEYCENPSVDEPNKNDHIYLEYCELLMQAKEAGAGYRVENEGTLHIVPTPLVKIDNQNRFHSDELPAVRWKGGKEFYYLCGTEFDEELWRKITSGSLTAKDLAEIEDVDQRKIAMTYLTGDDFVREMNAKLVGTGEPTHYKHLPNNRVAKSDTEADVTSVNRLYKIPAGDVYDKDKYFLRYTNPSTSEEHLSFVTQFVEKYGKNADRCMAAKHNCRSSKEFREGGGA